MKQLLLICLKVFLLLIFLGMMPPLIISFLMVFFNPATSFAITTLLFVILIVFVIY